MADVGQNKSSLDDGSVKILELAAEALIDHTAEWLREMKESLNHFKKQKKQMSSAACRDFLFAIISNSVIFPFNEAKENLGFVDENLIEAIKGDHDRKFDPNIHWDEEYNLDICYLVLKIAASHFKGEYLSGKMPKVISDMP